MPARSCKRKRETAQIFLVARVTERIERFIGHHQEVIAIVESTFIVGAPAGQQCPQTAVQRNGRFEGGGPIFVGFVPGQQRPGVGQIVDEKPTQIPGRVAATTVTEIDDAGDLALIDQHMGGIKSAVKKMPDRP